MRPKFTLELIVPGMPLALFSLFFQMINDLKKSKSSNLSVRDLLNK